MQQRVVIFQDNVGNFSGQCIAAEGGNFSGQCIGPIFKGQEILKREKSAITVNWYSLSF